MPGPAPNEFGKNIPAVNGIIRSLGWVTPLPATNTDYYEPEGGIKESTQKNFHKVLKDQFGLDLESDFRGSYNRIFVSNQSIQMQLDEYYQKMEEYEIMPESKETYKLREKAATVLENALFYEMAKGGLAIIPAGEVEPRQIRCDVSTDTFVITEPFSQCRVPEIMKKYKVHEPVIQPVPAEPVQIRVPDDFTEDEPAWPEKPQPVSANPPGREPVPPRFMRRPEEPQRPQDPMRFGSMEKLAEEIFKKKLEESGLKEPSEQLEDPGEFDMEEPDEVKKPDIILPEPPDKPEACDIADQMYEDLEKESPVLDPKYLRIRDVPDPFTEKEPVRPVMVRPPEVPDPVYLKLTARPRLKYQYEFEAPEEPHLNVPEKKIPEAPTLDLSDLEEPQYPELGEEPENPGGVARFFRWFSSDTRRKIAAHDKWLNDKATLSHRREQWEKDHDAYNEKMVLRKEKYEKEKAEYEKLKEEYRKEAESYQEANNVMLLRYTRKSEAYQEALKKFGGESYRTAMDNYKASRMNGDYQSSDPDVAARHQKLKKAYEEQLEMAKAKLSEEKIREEQAYQKELEKWEKENKEAIEVNLDKKAEFETKLEEFYQELEKWEENFGDCHDDPELTARKQEALEADYQDKLSEFFKNKENYDNSVKKYEESVERCRENAKKQGMDPEEAFEANRQIRIDEKLFEAKIDQYHKYMNDHPEIKEYQDKLLDYEEKVQNKEWGENAYNEYLEEKEEYDRAKLEYDQKKAAFNNLEEAKKQYKADVEKLRKEAEKEAKDLINNAQKAQEDYKAKYEKYKKDDEYWVEQKKIFDENVRRMYQPGGVHTRWEERKKAYEADNQRYKEQVSQYEKEKLTYKPRHMAWEQRKKNHEEEVRDYKAKKAVYDLKMEEINKIRNENEIEIQRANAADLKDPLFKDYVMNIGRYFNDYWPNKINGDYKVEQRRKMDLSNEAEMISAHSKTYQKMKKAAPDKVSKVEMQSYELRKKEKAHLDKYPSGMKSFVKNLYNAEKTVVRDAVNTKDLNKEAYRDAALKSMYLSVVSKKTDAFARTADGLLGHTEKIDNLLTKDNMNYAIRKMKENKALINSIDSQFKSCKTNEDKIRTLQDKDGLNTLYDKSYTPTKKAQTVYDPVLGEKRAFGELKKGL